MTPNQEYKRIFARTYDGLIERKRQIYREGTEAFAARHDAEVKKRRPKGKAGKNYVLPMDVVEALRAEFMSLTAEYEFLAGIIEAAQKRRKERLQELCDTVNIVTTDEFHKIETSYVSSYSSQTQSNLYAEGHFLPLKVSLENVGVPTRTDFCQDGMPRYELWARCPPFVAEAVSRRITLGEVCRIWKSRQINPFVYNPFIPHALGSF